MSQLTATQRQISKILVRKEAGSDLVQYLLYRQILYLWLRARLQTSLGKHSIAEVAFSIAGVSLTVLVRGPGHGVDGDSSPDVSVVCDQERLQLGRGVNGFVGDLRYVEESGEPRSISSISDELSLRSDMLDS